MLNKNPDKVFNELEYFRDKIKDNVPGVALFSESFEKAEFVNKLISTSKVPVVLADVDLMCTGLYQSEMIQKNNNLQIIHLDKNNWKQTLDKIICMTSKQESLLIVDSLNLLYNSWDGLESARFINSCVMLLASLAHQANSSVLLTAMARKKKDGKWVISPGGKQIIKSGMAGIYFLEKSRDNFTISEINLGSEDQDLNTVIKSETPL